MAGVLTYFRLKKRKRRRQLLRSLLIPSSRRQAWGTSKENKSQRLMK